MSILPIGKQYRGKEIEDVPSDFLRWLLEQDWFLDKYPELADEINEELQWRTDWSKHFYSERVLW